MLAIFGGLLLGVLMIPLTEIKRLVDVLYLEEARDRTRNRAAEKIQTRFWRNMWKRRYRQRTDGTRDPYSVMGRVTAWDMPWSNNNYTHDAHEASFLLNDWGTGLAQNTGRFGLA